MYIFNLNIKSFSSGELSSLLLCYLPLSFFPWSDVQCSWIDSLGFFLIFSTTLFLCSTSEIFPRSNFPTLLLNYFLFWQIHIYYLGENFLACVYSIFTVSYACLNIFSNLPEDTQSLEKFPPVLCMDPVPCCVSVHFDVSLPCWRVSHLKTFDSSCSRSQLNLMRVLWYRWTLLILPICSKWEQFGEVSKP